MRDKGIVISTNADMAQVEVQCFVNACQKCSAQSLCVGLKQSKGLLTVKNPIYASPGNEVEIEIPDANYSRALIVLFGALLLSSLAGLGIGFALSFFLPIPSSVTSLAGFFLAFPICGFNLFHYFQKRNMNQLYPVIINILQKGDRYG
jgi:positive regulator of sigma E activity